MPDSVRIGECDTFAIREAGPNDPSFDWQLINMADGTLVMEGSALSGSQVSLDLVGLLAPGIYSLGLEISKACGGVINPVEVEIGQVLPFLPTDFSTR